MFLQDLAVVTIVAALASLFFQKLKFPLVFGLLAAGVIIGPNTPPFGFIQDEANLQTLADLGVVLILFGLGLEFDLRSIRRVGLAAAAVMVVEVVLMLWFGFEIGLLLGWSRLDAIFLGAMMSISSTAIIVSVLRELGRLDEESTRVIFAVLVLEDVAAILILVLLGGYAATGSLPVQEAALVGGRMLLFIVGGLAIGLVALPRFFDVVAKRFRPEVSVLCIVGLALGGAFLSEIAGFHAGLGAFLAGAVISEAKQKHTIEERFRPVHDLFAAVFFVSIGTLVDFAVLGQYWRPVALVTLVIVVGKFLGGSIATFFAGYSPKTSIEVGASLAQIGEFSFVIAAVGIATGTMSEFLFPVIVASAALSSFASPMLIRYGPRFSAPLSAFVPAPVRTYAAVYTNWMKEVRSHDPAKTGPSATARRRAILSGILALVVLGSGLAGQRTGQLLLSTYLGTSVAGLAYWGVLLVVLLPLGFEFAREIWRWTDAAQNAKGLHGPPLGVRLIVRTSLYLLGLLVVGLPALVAASQFVRGPTVFVVWLAVVGLVLLLLWRAIRTLHGRLHENVEAILRDEKADLPVPEIVQAVVARGLHGPLGTETIAIGARAWAGGKTLAEIGLRTHTGASIVLINRGDTQLPPGPALALMPGDLVVALGSHDEVEAAREMLNRPMPAGGPPRMQPGQLFVAETSPIANRTLAESGLRTRFGLQVVAVQRGPSVIANPAPNEPLLPGDVLTVLGTSKAVLDATEFLRDPVPPESGKNSSNPSG